jgi:phage replication initiation protein
MRLRDLIARNGGRLTRVDIAFDDLEGERTVHDVREAYRAGEFKNRGQNPRSQMVGPWDEPEHWGAGLTYYVGTKSSGKQLCAYEKGRQLGDESSPWVRFEVRLGRLKDREIPLDALTDPASYFVGAYEWLSWARQADSAPRGRVSQLKAQITLRHLVFHCRRSYGKLVDVLRKELLMDADTIVSGITKIGTPGRLNREYVHPDAMDFSMVPI